MRSVRRLIGVRDVGGNADCRVGYRRHTAGPCGREKQQMHRRLIHDPVAMAPVDISSSPDDFPDISFLHLLRHISSLLLYRYLFSSGRNLPSPLVSFMTGTCPIKVSGASRKRQSRGVADQPSHSRPIPRGPIDYGHAAKAPIDRCPLSRTMKKRKEGVKVPRKEPYRVRVDNVDRGTCEGFVGGPADLRKCIERLVTPSVTVITNT